MDTSNGCSTELTTPACTGNLTPPQTTSTLSLLSGHESPSTISSTISSNFTSTSLPSPTSDEPTEESSSSSPAGSPVQSSSSSTLTTQQSPSESSSSTYIVSSASSASLTSSFPIPPSTSLRQVETTTANHSDGAATVSKATVTKPVTTPTVSAAGSIAQANPRTKNGESIGIGVGCVCAGILLLLAWWAWKKWGRRRLHISPLACEGFPTGEAIVPLTFPDMRLNESKTKNESDSSPKHIRIHEVLSAPSGLVLRGSRYDPSSSCVSLISAGEISVADSSSDTAFSARHRLLRELPRQPTDSSLRTSDGELPRERDDDYANSEYSGTSAYWAV